MAQPQESSGWPEVSRDPVRAGIRACEKCAAAADAALASDPSYTSPGTDRYSQLHLALLSCESTCRLTAMALSEWRGDILDMCAWCAEVAMQCACAARQHESDASERVELACLRCVAACEAVIRAVAA